MKTPFLLLTLTLTLAAGRLRAEPPEVTLQTLPPGMVLNTDHLRATRQTIDAAVAANRTDILYLELINDIDLIYCLDQVEKVERVKQAQLVRRLLLDRKFVQAAEERNTTSVWDRAPALHRHIVLAVLMFCP